ncbi:MAG: endolytic transglycosylase MltG [Firmicutes bacterium]|nr:endolytic transglycosylase MltG [Bacillota bacterium]
MKKFLLFLVLFITVIAAILLIGYGTFLAPQTIAEDVRVEIQPGSSTTTISRQLCEAGLTKKDISFKLYSRINEIDSQLKAGNYTFEAGSWSIKAVAATLIKGVAADDDVRVTIPEGLMVKEVAQIFADAELCDYDTFMEAAKNGDYSQFDFLPAAGSEYRMEGFLFPDTYMISPRWSAEEIITNLLEHFEEAWVENGFDELAKAQDLTVYEVVTMASLIEREAQVDADRPLIASVIYNRLDINMRLQLDCSIQFILGEQHARILYEHLEIDSPYNLYKNKGLTPGPIAAPGIASIDAVFNPADTDYLYYRAKTDGSHRFSLTYDEHLAYHEGDLRID